MKVKKKYLIAFAVAMVFSWTYLVYELLKVG